MFQLSSDSLANLCSFTAQVIFPLAQIYVVQNHFTIYEICYMRGFATILLSLVTAKHKNISLNVTITKNFGLLLLRNLQSISWILALTLSYYYLTFANIYSINVCGALFVFLWDSYLFGIETNKYQKLGVFLGILGSIMIINANFLIKLVLEDYQSTSDFSHYKSTQPIHIFICSAVLLISNILVAHSNSITKTIKVQKDSCEITFHWGILLVFFSAIGWILSPDSEPKDIKVYFWAVLLTTLPQVLATYLSTLAFLVGKKSGIVGIFMTVSVIVSYAIDALRYNQSSNPIALVGSVLILAGISLTILKKSLPKQENQQQISN